jgi:hypothetical protein
MTIYHNSAVHSRLLPRCLSLGIAMALAGVAIQPAHAVEFGDPDGLHGTVNTTVSYGIAYRTQNVSNSLIGKAHFNPAIGAQPLGGPAQRAAIGRWSVNSDDGDLAYGRWAPISNAVSANIELNVKYGEDWGAFVRGYAFYDDVNDGRYNLSSDAEKRVGKDAKFLDFFLWHNFNVDGHTGTGRLGRQVVSWGESTFIQGGVSSAINPVDVSKLHVAGAELKQAFVPINMLWGSFNFTDALSAEAYYQFEYQQTDPDPVGSFFSTNDYATIGGRYVMLNFGTVPQPVVNPDRYYDVCYGRNYQNSDTGLPPALVQAGCSASFPRGRDRYPSEDGQFGGALRYMADWLNNTEFGFYAINYHSKLPLVSGIAVTAPPSGVLPVAGSYFVEYPKDIHLFAMSFNTLLETGGIALQGELSYRPNVPLQLHSVELLFAGLTPLNGVIPQPALRFVSQLGQFAPGQEIQGWERHKMSQLQLTATKVFGPDNLFRANQIALVGEVGFDEVWDLPGGLRFNGDGTDTGGGADVTTGYLRNPITQTNGFATKFSWGYRVAARGDYNNVFGTPFNLSPRVAFSHDVGGISPGPGGNFIRGRKAVTVGAEATYIDRWAFDLAYTNYFGAGDLNLIRDRDFIQFTAKYSF